MADQGYCVELREQADGVILWRILPRNKRSSRTQAPRKIRKHLANIAVLISGLPPSFRNSDDRSAPVAGILKALEGPNAKHINPSISKALLKVLSAFLMRRATRSKKRRVERYQRKPMALRKSPRKKPDQEEGDSEGIVVKSVDVTKAEERLKAHATLGRYRCRSQSSLRKLWVLE